MSLSTFAYIIGLFQLLVGLPLLFSPVKTTKWVSAFCEEDELMRILGMVLVMISFFVLKEDTLIGANLAGIMRLMAWITGIKGIVLVWTPASFLNLRKRMLKDKTVQSIGGIAVCAVGVLFMMAGAALG